MKTRVFMLGMAMSCIFAGNALALTKAEYDTQKNRINADYKVNRDNCGSLKSNAKDICLSEAKGAEKVAKAELEAQYKPGTKQSREVAMVKADSAYDIAKEKCDDLTGNSKDICIKDAKAVQVKAREEAKVNKATTDASTNRAASVNEVKKEAISETRSADYQAAKARCDSFAGNAKDTCQKDAKAKFGM